MNSGPGSYFFNYVIYIFIALIFAGVAGLYVITLAPYAAGSGIPEVREGGGEGEGEREREGER